MNNMIIRTYEGTDKASVITLWSDCGLVVPQNDPEKDIERKRAVGRDLFLVGTVNGAVVATVMGGYEGHRGWINYLAVKPSEQRKGYGQKMMGAIEEKLRSCGCPKINLQVRSTNKKVIEFYKTMGYGNDDVISLGKRLDFDSV